MSALIKAPFYSPGIVSRWDYYRAWASALKIASLLRKITGRDRLPAVEIDSGE
jgi:hypothetical protein